jgi:hypothetical protein
MIDFNMCRNNRPITDWVFPEKLPPPPKEEISAIRGGKAENFVSDNSKGIRTSKGGRWV